MKDRGETGYVHTLKLCPQSYLLIIKGKIVTPQWKKPADISFNPGSDRGWHHLHIIRHHASPGIMLGERHIITSKVFLPNIRNLIVIIRKHQTILNWRAPYKMSQQYFSKVLRSWERRKDQGAVTEETKET